MNFGRPVLFAFLFIVFVSTRGFADGFFEIDPKFEGVYDVELKCSPPGDGQCRKIEGASTIGVVNSIGSGGVKVGVNVGDYGLRVWSFTVNQYEQGGAVLQGESDAESIRIGEFHIEVNPQTRAISGWISDSSIADRIIITGRQACSSGDYYSDKAPKLSFEELEGVYAGGGGNLSGKLIIKRKSLSGGAAFTASFVNDSVSMVIAFPITQFLSEKGVLNLVKVSPDQHTLKWTLSLGTDSGGVPTLRGIAFTSGSMPGTRFNFKKVAGISVP